MKRRAQQLCILVVFSGLLLGFAGCRREKPEVLVMTDTPTVVAAVSTPTAEPTLVTSGVQPTVVSVAEVATPTPTWVAGLPTLTPVPTVTPTGAIPTATPTSTAAPGGYFVYTVQWGDWLYAIARRFGTTVEAILALNPLPNPNYLSVGQQLRIPGSSQPTPGGYTEYVVQPGDTLYSIAMRYGVTVDAIVRLNGIINPWFIRAGQTLLIPQAGAPSATGPGGGGAVWYTVQAGDTLYSIAARYGTTPMAIMSANNLPNDLIVPGQVLLIPQ
ncbi:MAG: LysM peptidoglycan-binding domain-containing protein [Chloroflexi bacterium]|nr:LysM peptidoglycan-binding domain-containing protein [Chloroflexota bacterium]